MDISEPIFLALPKVLTSHKTTYEILCLVLITFEKKLKCRNRQGSMQDEQKMIQEHDIAYICKLLEVDSLL